MSFIFSSFSVFVSLPFLSTSSPLLRLKYQRNDCIRDYAYEIVRSLSLFRSSPTINARTNVATLSLLSVGLIRRKIDRFVWFIARDKCYITGVLCTRQRDYLTIDFFYKVLRTLVISTFRTLQNRMKHLLQTHGIKDRFVIYD